MITVPYEVIEAASNTRPEGYLEEVLARSTPVQVHGKIVALEFQDADYEQLRGKYSDKSLGHDWAAKDNGTIVCRLCDAERDCLTEQQDCPSKLARECEMDPDGPGTLLSESLALIGIVSDANCGCRKKAKRMNCLGPDGCEANLEEIVEGLREEAANRGMIFSEVIALMMVRRAIRLSRRRKAKSKA